jgi:hypothetical protein
LHVDHRYGAAKLKLRNQLEKESRRRLAARESLIGARLRVAAKIPMPCDATEIEPAFAGVCRESVAEGLTERGTPVTLERENAAEDRDQRLWRIGAARVRNR